ncbi:stressosome-associated protein Prli42 [Virgibacillus byunsanensis]|uniref:Stressosome-associated protein Prli42 n=1 Tax=Virgibacillus byunsanensis TaxID=570945 RepID=A0ABW3LNF0_9BACI
MVAKQAYKSAKPRKSKRERRVKVVIYIMVIAMVLSAITTGLAMFASF